MEYFHEVLVILHSDFQSTTNGTEKYSLHMTK
jgi:hypothetical protein